jgi:hypothetical protein
MVTLKKLDIFWRHSNCPVRFKIQAVDAVVRSKLLYGMETAQLNEGELRRIEIVHLKILRKLKGMKTTFVNRNNTNREVYRRVNQAMENEGGKRKVVPFKRAYLRSKVKRMAKIVREEGSEGNKIFFRKGLEEWDYCNRRVGRPKYSWTKKALGELWGITKKRRVGTVANLNLIFPIFIFLFQPFHPYFLSHFFNSFHLFFILRIPALAP